MQVSIWFFYHRRNSDAGYNSDKNRSKVIESDYTKLDIEVRFKYFEKYKDLDKS